MPRYEITAPQQNGEDGRKEGFLIYLETDLARLCGGVEASTGEREGQRELLGWTL